MFVNDLFKKNKMNEGFDELEAYMKAKLAPKPRGGAGVKQGTYGQPDRRRGRPAVATGGQGSSVPQSVDFDRPHSERSAGRRLPRYSDDHDANFRREVDEGSAQDRLHRRHQELRKKSGLPDPEYYRELKASYDIENDSERLARQAEIKKKYRVAEGISVVDTDYDLDQMVLTLDIEGTKKHFTYWDYDENFENAERKDIFDQLQDQPWYSGLDHPTKMEILDAAYNAIRGLEPSEYRPTVGDEPLDEAGPFSYGAKKPRKGSVADLAAKKRKEQEKDRKPIEPRDQIVGVAKVVTNEDIERYLEEMSRAGYEVVTEAATLCPECGGAAYANQMLAEKQDACYHKVKSRYKVWPSAYASGALVRCRKVGAKNWGNKSKK
jgi:hypothetical protein